jgi:hypothetical protein
MKRPTSKTPVGADTVLTGKQAAPESRTWRASLIRGKRMEFLGFVYKAVDRQAAEVAAVAEFGLNEEEVKGLVIQEQP